MHLAKHHPLNKLFCVPFLSPMPAANCAGTSVLVASCTVFMTAIRLFITMMVYQEDALATKPILKADGICSTISRRVWHLLVGLQARPTTAPRTVEILAGKTAVQPKRRQYHNNVAKTKNHLRHPWEGCLSQPTTVKIFTGTTAVQSKRCLHHKNVAKTPKPKNLCIQP